MDSKTQERIKADAEGYANGIGDVYRKYAARYGYIAGATAENDRAQVLVDALEAIDHELEHRQGGTFIGMSPRQQQIIYNLAYNALEQWKSGKGKGKEVGDE